MRARLKQMEVGQEFQFICAADMAGRMDRVIMINDGRIEEKTETEHGVVITVNKT